MSYLAGRTVRQFEALTAPLPQAYSQYLMLAQPIFDPTKERFSGECITVADSVWVFCSVCLLV